MEAYCVKCKTKREMQNPEATFTSSGTPGTRGVCPLCGTNLFRMGRTPAHEELTPPERGVPSPRKKANRKKAHVGKLVIVESPAKARTIGKYLGKEYTVRASVGHIRDLLRSQLSVDVENDFAPRYCIPNDKRPLVKELQALVQSADAIYLATDPDREGEAIAWHLTEATDMDPARTHRVEFHEITRSAIEQAFNHPRAVNMNLVDAQQARRVLDRLVGYNLSPLLWNKVRSRLSAGRVQSVALRMIVEREREIEAFEPVEYWTIAAIFTPEAHPTDSYTARLVQVDEAEPQLPNEAHAAALAEDMRRGAYKISNIKRGERRRRPLAPFTTSTMQQDASRRFGFTPSRTMALAQQLYEGIALDGDESVGLITYMRTDSTAISKDAQAEARRYIASVHGEKFVPETPPVYRSRAQRAQEAHEAVRPTSVARTPEMLKAYLSRDQYRLYRLIWQRFVASQMEAAIYDMLSVEIDGQSAAHKYRLRVSGSTLRFPGFLVVYESDKEEEGDENGNGDGKIPAVLEENQPQTLREVLPEQHFTQPPPRYSEATLVRALEENGIGRPSTYAPTMSTLQQRGYVYREQKRLLPTETGVVVNDLLVQYFNEEIAPEFTAQMENALDEVAEGKERWPEVVRRFYEPFARKVEIAHADMPEVKAAPEPIGRDCPECGHALVIRYGRFGKFISCSHFPDCRYTEPWLEKIGVACPKDGGDLVERKSRKGRIFYTCANYPNCDYTSWKRPLPMPCPSCQGLLVIARKNTAQCTQCERTYPLAQLSEPADEQA
ncbi:MAG: type I DNA topoisomerase [Anaerolineales bacterium]